MEAASKINETMTKLAGFEARYRTLGDLEVVVFRQTRSGIAASVTSGICDRVTALLTLDDLDKLRGYLIEAKGRLDEIK
jgi:lipoate-protein ligase A